MVYLEGFFEIPEKNLFEYKISDRRNEENNKISEAIRIVDDAMNVNNSYLTPLLKIQNKREE